MIDGQFLEQRKMVKIRQYDEVGREKIRDFLGDCKIVADLGCNKERILPTAVGYDVDVGVNPDRVVDFNDPIFSFDRLDGYDGICMSHLLEHIIDTRHILRQCYKVLFNGGRIAIACPDGETVPSNTLGDSSGTHEQLFTPKTLKLYLENVGFKDVYTEYYDRPNAYKQTQGIFARGVK